MEVTEKAQLIRVKEQCYMLSNPYCPNLIRIGGGNHHHHHHSLLVLSDRVHESLIVVMKSFIMV